VGVSPDYRLCPQSVFPAQVEDAKAAVRFLRANAASLKVDPSASGRWGSPRAATSR
jgi:acetyl esterase/lipase